MDTNTAIQTLTSLQTTLQSNVTAYQGQSDALTVALGIIKGTLQTQSDALDAKYKQQIADLTVQVTSLSADRDAAISQVSDLTAQVKDLTTQLTDIKAQISALVSLLTPVAPAVLDTPIDVQPATL